MTTQIGEHITLTGDTVTSDHVIIPNYTLEDSQMTTRDAILEQISEREEAQAYRAMIMEAAHKVQAQRERRTARAIAQHAKRSLTWGQSLLNAGPL